MARINLIEALKGVKKDDEGFKCYLDIEEIREALGLGYMGYDSDYNKAVEARINAWYLKATYDTDTWVGIVAIFVDDELVGSSLQDSRKGDTSYYWVSNEAVGKTRKVLVELQKEDNLSGSLIDPSEEIEELYGVHYPSQQLENRALYKGLSVRVLRGHERPDAESKPWLKYGETKLWIELPTSDLLMVPVSELSFGIRTRAKPAEIQEDHSKGKQ